MLSKFDEISFQEYFTEWIFHPVFSGDLVCETKEGQMWSDFRLVGL